MKKHIKYIGIALFAIILLRTDLKKLLIVISQIDAGYLFVAILLNLPLFFLKSYRWNRLLRIQGIYLPLLQSFLIYASSIYLGFVTPGRLGEFAKALYLKNDNSVALSRGMSSVFLDRLLDLYLLVILAIIGMWRFNILGRLSNISLILIVITVLAPLCALNKRLMIYLFKLLFNSVILNKLKDKVGGKFEIFYTGISQLINLKLLYSGLLTCLIYILFFAQCYLLVVAMHLSIDFISVVLFMSISNLISFLPVSIAGLGTRDVALIYLFSIIGLKPEIAVSYSFLIFITFFVCGGTMGAVAWWLKPITPAYDSQSKLNGK